MDLGMVKIGVIVIGVALAIGYIKELILTFSDEEEKEINDSANEAMKLFPKNVWTIAVMVIQGIRLMASLGFTIGAVYLLDGALIIAPFLFVLTDAVYVVYGMRRMLKIADAGAITEVEDVSNWHYFINLVLVGVTIGSLF